MYDKYKDIISSFSTRDLEVMKLLLKGNRTSEIAKRMQLDYKSAAAISRDIKSRLGIDNIEQLAEIKGLEQADGE